VNEPDYHRVLGLGIILLVAAALLFVYLVDDADAGPFTPPTRHAGQRILADAYDAELRSYTICDTLTSRCVQPYRRAGIVTRCRANKPYRYLFCTTHAHVGTLDAYWQMTEVRIERGTVHTVLTPSLAGVVRIPRKAIFYRVTPLKATP